MLCDAMVIGLSYPKRLFFEKTETNCHTNVVFFITLFAIYNKTAYFCIEKNEKDKTHLIINSLKIVLL